MKTRKSARTANTGRAKQTEDGGPKTRPKTPRAKAGVAGTPKKTTRQLKGARKPAGKSAGKGGRKPAGRGAGSVAATGGGKRKR